MTAAQKALIPDPRNDENLIVAQTHTAMISFHNKVVDRLPASMPAAQKFTVARKRVTLHYQWLLRHDYLPRDLPARRGRRRLQERPQADPARRDPDGHPDDADRVLGGCLPARAQHGPRRVQLEQPLPRHRGHPRLHVPVLRHGRRPRGREAAARQLDRRLATDVRLPGRRQARPGRARERRELRDAHRHPPHRPARLAARRAPSAATTTSGRCRATWPSATSPAPTWSRWPAASRWSPR